MALRDDIVRLATEHPELRAYLVPVLDKEAGASIDLGTGSMTDDVRAKLKKALTHIGEANKLFGEAMMHAGMDGTPPTVHKMISSASQDLFRVQMNMAHLR